ncbi:23684_t:CDS:2, partial [Gigaspora margarita]
MYVYKNVKTSRNHDCEVISRQCKICYQKGHNARTCPEDNENDKNLLFEFSKSNTNAEVENSQNNECEDKSRQCGICHQK